MSHLNQSNELEWTAFRYIAGELSAADVVRFEERLAVDQDACEAVVRAVQLTEAVMSLPQSPIPSAPQPAHADDYRETRSAWASVALAAACLLLAVGTLISTRSNYSSATLQAETEELVDLWADSNSALDDWSEDDSDVAAGSAEEEEFAVPNWMLAAAEIDSADQEASPLEPESLQDEGLQQN